MNNNYKLTIAILSYNRPKELLRTIESILPSRNSVEILVCDDNSPKLSDIEYVIKSLSPSPNFRFISNPVNLGYDRNLFQVIELASSNNVLLLGDDDYLEDGAVDNILRFIDERDDFKCAFLRFKDDVEMRYHRYSSADTYFESNTVCENGSYIYNSVLFSGLLFKRDAVVDNKPIFDKYLDSIYIQVAIFIFLSFKFGSYSIFGPGIIVGGDGQSGFGYNDSARSEDFELKDRSNILSNLVYHKRLFKVISGLNEGLHMDILNAFLKEYRLRSIKALLNARKLGRPFLMLYWSRLKDLNVLDNFVYKIMFLFIYFSPLKLSLFLSGGIERVIFKYRDLNNNLKSKYYDK